LSAAKGGATAAEIEVAKVAAVKEGATDTAEMVGAARVAATAAAEGAAREAMRVAVSRRPR